MGVADDDDPPAGVDAGDVAVGDGDDGRAARGPQRRAGGAAVQDGRGAEDRVAALGQRRERTDEGKREAGDRLRLADHEVDVPVLVVVGEERAADVGRGAGGAQVAGRGEDRVDGVVGIAQPVVVGIVAVGLPRGGHELHPPQRAGARDRDVGVCSRSRPR